MTVLRFLLLSLLLSAPAIASAQQAVAQDPDLDPRPPVLSTHEPLYIIVGRRNETSAKLQLSFKYRLFDDESALTQFLPLLGKLHFGYTQTSLWDIGGESAPFRDTSYRPSFFYHEDNFWRSPDGQQRLSFAAGVGLRVQWSGRPRFSVYQCHLRAHALAHQYRQGHVFGAVAEAHQLLRALRQSRYRCIPWLWRS